MKFFYLLDLSNVIIAAALGQIVLAIISVFLFSKYQNKFENFLTTSIFLVFFGLTLYAEYFVLGENSFIFMGGEGNVVNPLLNYLSNSLKAGQIFAHEFAGGSDLYSMLGYGMQYFSIEKILFSIFPHWIAVALHKLFGFTLAIIGTYLLCRKGLKATHSISMAIACFYSIVDFSHLFFSIILGPGYFVIPLALYLSVCRANEKNYYSGILFLLVLTSAVLPTHFSPILFAIISGAIIFKSTRLDRIFITLCLVTIGMLINWHEVVFALSQIAPLTERGSEGQDVPTLFQAIKYTFNSFPILNPAFWLYSISLVILIVGRDPFAWRAVASLLILPLLILAIQLFPWELLNMKQVRGLTLAWAYVALNTIVIPVTAYAAKSLLENKRIHKLTKVIGNPASWAFGLAIGLLLWGKTVSAIHFIKHAGQSQYHSIQNLSTPSWAPKSLFRVVTLRSYQPDPDIVAGFYQFDTFDGFQELPLLNKTLYWRYGIRREFNKGREMPSLDIDYKYWPKGEKKYQFTRQFSTKMLGIANVGYILSPFPLEGIGLKKISGPNENQTFYRDFRAGGSFRTYFKKRLNKIFKFGDIYIYSIPNHLPRVFVLRDTKIVADNAPIAEIMKVVKKFALDRIAIIRASKRGDLKVTHRTAKVSRVQKILNGYEIFAAAPNGGAVALNVPFSPFWKAYVDNKPMPIVSVNEIQMAVSIPAGAKKIIFRYERPLLRDKISCYLFSGPLCSN